jgi:hypothetical protein
MLSLSPVGTLIFLNLELSIMTVGWVNHDTRFSVCVKCEFRREYFDQNIEITMVHNGNCILFVKILFAFGWHESIQSFESFSFRHGHQIWVNCEFGVGHEIEDQKYGHKFF